MSLAVTAWAPSLKVIFCATSWLMVPSLLGQHFWSVQDHALGLVDLKSHL